MQDSLDPTIGQTEIVAMRKEIHKMELRYDTLRKQQEKMIKDMERAVFKRETIQLKYLPKVEKKNAEDRCKFCSSLIIFSIPGQTIKTNRKFEADPETHY